MAYRKISIGFFFAFLAHKSGQTELKITLQEKYCHGIFSYSIHVTWPGYVATVEHSKVIISVNMRIIICNPVRMVQRVGTSQLRIHSNAAKSLMVFMYLCIFHYLNKRFRERETGTDHFGKF